MHNSTKIKLPSQDAFYNALGSTKEEANEIIKETLAKESRQTERLVRERMDKFFKDTALIAGNNVVMDNGEPLNLNALSQEPFNALLEDEMMELERQVREAIENVVYLRKTAVKELEPLAKEVISQQYSVDRIEFEKEEQPDQEDQTADIDTMLKEYQDAIKFLPQFEKTLVETKTEAEQLNDVLKCGKHL